MSTISCVIVSYNNAPYIRQAITSVLDQSLHVNEIIVADDGSSDDSRAIIEALAHQHPVIYPLFRKKNLGVAANRDLAVRAARGDLITTLDGDDWLFKDKLAAENLALTRSDANVAYSDITQINKDLTVKRELSMQHFSTLSLRDRRLALARNSCPLPRDPLFSRQAYLNAGGIRHALPLYEDWEFLIRMGLTEPPWAYSGTRGTAYREADGMVCSLKQTMVPHV